MKNSGNLYKAEPAVCGVFEGLDPEDRKALADVAVLEDGGMRGGTYLLKDAATVCSFSSLEGVEILPVAEALKLYDWLRDRYFWGLMKKDDNPLPPDLCTDDNPSGFFIRVRKGVSAALPVQAALYMSGSAGRQALHNVVVLEEGAGLELITGCVSGSGFMTGEHIAVSEAYVGKNASFTNTMVHSWTGAVRVKPYSATSVAEGGCYISNYISLRPAGLIESEPVAYLNGCGASAKFFSVILGSEDSEITMGGDVYLNADDTSAEIAHRAVCTEGRIIQKGLLIGKARCRAHVDCSGMLISPGGCGYIESVPGLQSHHEEAAMSHEASIGRIAPRQVQYLMARGMEEREAVSMLVRGFLDTDIKGLGPELDRRIMEIAELAGHGE